MNRITRFDFDDRLREAMPDGPYWSYLELTDTKGRTYQADLAAAAQFADNAVFRRAFSVRPMEPLEELP